MTRMQVTPTEHGLIRLFAVDLPLEDIKPFHTHTDDAVWPVQEALGASDLDPARVELFDVADLDELGLTGYMTEGLGIAASDLATDAARLDGLTGHVLIVFSAAFRSTAQSLTPRAPLRWIGTYAEEAAHVRFQPLPTDAAKGILSAAPPKTANPHLTLLWALLALPVLALIVGAVIYGVTR
ncbi:hypothetical protein [Shimia sediminis]|uniref:hypothetical protein n=1 Tax=Shimia sediminis TaxID=2497945 RepID=UPI000F8C66CF|nr:hypothetical protein [Shimia sediminis]